MLRYLGVTTALLLIVAMMMMLKTAEAQRIRDRQYVTFLLFQALFIFFQAH